MHEFFIPVVPVGKARARTVRQGGKVRTFTPSKTKAFEKCIAMHGKAYMQHRDILTGPVCLTMHIRCKVPESWSHKRKTAALNQEIVPTTKPDTSNIVKAVEDALNGVLYVDDNQIVQLSVLKSYAVEPGILVSAYELDKQRAQGAA